MLRVLAVALIVVCSQAADLRGLIVPLSRSDMERAVALARWPRTDAERMRFHERYIFRIQDSPTEFWTVEQVEVITEFRRIALMAEEHERVNDHWGRAGIRDVEESIKPWRGRVAIVARLGLRSNPLYVGTVPPVELELGGRDVVSRLDERRTNLYGGCMGGDDCVLTGGLVEYLFDAAAVGQAIRLLTVRWNGQVMARVAIDFAAFE